jgi:hypothetical protein
LWSKRGRELANETEKAYQNNGIPKTFRQFKHSGTTPGGAEYRSTVPFPLDAQRAYDAGIQKQIDIFTQSPDYRHWPNARNISDYRLDLIEPSGINEVNEPGAPHTTVDGITTAGTVIGMGEMWEELKLFPRLVIPHQAGQGWRFLNYLRDTAWFEGEHLCEFMNRTSSPENLYLYYTHMGDVHPHRPDPNGVVGLKAQAHPQCAGRQK